MTRSKRFSPSNTTPAELPAKAELTYPFRSAIFIPYCAKRCRSYFTVICGNPSVRSRATSLAPDILLIMLTIRFPNLLSFSRSSP